MEESSGRSPFRQESLDRVNSPEKLDDYVRLPNPSLRLPAAAAAMIALGAAAYFLAGRL